MSNLRCTENCNKSLYPVNKYYPVLPSIPNVCNIVSNEKLDNSTAEWIKNSTKVVNGKRVICNKSCLGGQTVCGLNSANISIGVL